MTTLILDLENDIDVEQFVSTVASMKGIKNIVLKNGVQNKTLFTDKQQESIDNIIKERYDMLRNLSR